MVDRLLLTQSQNKAFAASYVDAAARLLASAFGAASAIIVMTTPLTAKEQAIFAVVSAILFFVLLRIKKQWMTVSLALFSVIVSSRYIYWRLSDTIDYDHFGAFVIGIILITAEIYAYLVLLFGYFQNIWSLDRRPAPLPRDVSLWPAVDVYVPTYNESLSIVRKTVLACMSMDWPRDRLRVFVLDDGRREEFRRFSEEVGASYLSRPDNLQAKAGNLNSAMRQTDAAYIAVFDSDHIPTRAFLQMTMGWMLRNPRIALIQTPHHFYSPDPFQRNLTAGSRVPPEGNMFYGLVQEGNDFWNASFFCGSCAVLRREALNDIGGFAVETVTEDAHTMLKLHRRGWQSAYLKLPLAAGLATERLALHIGQRARWARGMIQILRLDNPVFGPGLTLPQRICYLQATGHFLFAIPRVVFLLSPLAFLLLDQNIIAASPVAITAYALPHIVFSIGVNSRLQKNWRHSFWSEIYETVLAMFLIRVTVETLINPKRGKFNVTEKGGLLEKGYFDLKAVYPNLILAALLVIGIGRGVVSLLVTKADSLTVQALVLNSIWATISLLTVMAALAVGRERRQLRSVARVSATIPVLLTLPDGRTMPATSRYISVAGADIACTVPPDFDGSEVVVEFDLGSNKTALQAEIVRWRQGVLHLSWQQASIEDEARIVRLVFGRADAWTHWANYDTDRPLRSLARVLDSIRGLFRPPERSAQASRKLDTIRDDRKRIAFDAAAEDRSFSQLNGR